MGIIKELLDCFRKETNCDGCGKPRTECNRECQAAADEDAAWFAEIK